MLPRALRFEQKRVAQQRLAELNAERIKQQNLHYAQREQVQGLEQQLIGCADEKSLVKTWKQLVAARLVLAEIKDAAVAAAAKHEAARPLIVMQVNEADSDPARILGVKHLPA